MQKIPTLFVRDPENRSRVINQATPGCEWVVVGEGVARRKYDGTCVMFDGERWWARREVKPGKIAPPNYVPISTDPVTGKTMGWEPIEQSAFAMFHVLALDVWSTFGYVPGTYELIGPKINGNPERVTYYELVEHASAEPFMGTPPRDFDGLSDWLLNHPQYEGIVWHHPDGRMAKLKRRDFC